MAIVVALSFRYTAQGIPFGFATEYLPVVTELQLRTAALQSCAGDDCDRTFGPVPEPVPEPLPEPLPSGEGG